MYIFGFGSFSLLKFTEFCALWGILIVYFSASFYAMALKFADNGNAILNLAHFSSQCARYL